MENDEISRAFILANLGEALDAALALAGRLVVQELPKSILFVLPPSLGDASVFLESDQRIELGALNDPQPIDGAIDWLWHAGHAAMFVDIYAQRVDADHTYVALLRSRRFILDKRRLYHHGEGYPPFHVTGLFAPQGWESVERDGKFKLGWMYEE